MGDEKMRLDRLMVERGLVETLALAQKLIMAGQVRVAGQVAAEAVRKISVDAEIAIQSGPRFVSRGGEKLEPALKAFGLTALSGRICADVGASTGGFTDCLLQHGAAKVYAIDVGYGILHWNLRRDPRVVVMERTNARHLTTLPEPVSLITMDASFISLRTLLPVARNWLDPTEGEIVALIKPQFEASRDEADKGEGVILDPAVHHKILTDILTYCVANGFHIQGLVRSSIKGPKGNVEFLLHLSLTSGISQDRTIEALIQNALA